MIRKYAIGEIFNLTGMPESEIIGIDHYKMTTLSGLHKEWTSYTLISKTHETPSRWWVSEGDGGVYTWEPVAQSEIKGIVDLNQSGLAILQVEGDSAVGSLFSASVFYRHDKEVYCQEAFEDQVLYMRGVLHLSIP